MDVLEVMSHLLGLVPLVIAETVDPITAIFSRDWAAAGGWSLFVGLCMAIVLAFFREILVPGKRARRTEEQLVTALGVIDQQTTQITKLTEANELTKYVISQVIPRPAPAPHTVAPTAGEVDP